MHSVISHFELHSIILLILLILIIIVVHIKNQR